MSGGTAKTREGGITYSGIKVNVVGAHACGDTELEVLRLGEIDGQVSEEILLKRPAMLTCSMRSRVRYPGWNGVVITTSASFRFFWKTLLGPSLSSVTARVG